MTTGHEYTDAGPFRFERRDGSRWEIDSDATAFSLAAESFGAMHDLKLVDASDGGVGAVSETAIHPGTVVSLGFSSPGFTARQGTVVRCMPCGHGYRIGVRFDRRLAA